MKALIISDKQDVITLLSKKLESDGYDIIIYRWLLKALDNIEEIRPDYIILSAQEYPRHWKTLASFVESGIGGNDVRFCLYNAEVLTTEEKEKAEKLGVEFFSDDDEENSIPTVTEIFTDNQKSLNEIKKEYSVAITSPITQKFIYGSAIQQSFDTFECELHFDNSTANAEHEKLIQGSEIKYISVCNDDDENDNVISFSGKITEINNDKILIKVLHYYEN